MNVIRKGLSKFALVLNKKVKKTNWYANQLVDKNLYPTNEWYREHEQRNFDIVNIGSSSALFAFDYSFTVLNGLNWAGKPQSLDLGYKLLRNFFSILRKSGVVCIPLCPLSGLAVQWAGKSEEDKFYGVMDYTLFEDYQKVSFKMGNPLRYNPKESIKRLIKDVASLKECSVTQLNEANFEGDATNWISIWKKEFGIQNLDAPVPEHLIEGMQRRNALMSEIVRFCLERDLRPVVMFTPVHSTLATYFNEVFYENYLSQIVSVAIENGATIIDMLKSKEFETCDFYNSFFLNSNGSQKFMKMLEKKIL